METPKRRPDTEGKQRDNSFEKAHKTSKDFLPEDGNNFKEPLSPDVNLDRMGLVQIVDESDTQDNKSM